MWVTAYTCRRRLLASQYLIGRLDQLRAGSVVAGEDAEQRNAHRQALEDLQHPALLVPVLQRLIYKDVAGLRHRVEGARLLGGNIDLELDATELARQPLPQPACDLLPGDAERPRG